MLSGCCGCFIKYLVRVDPLLMSHHCNTTGLTVPLRGRRSRSRGDRRRSRERDRGDRDRRDRDRDRERDRYSVFLILHAHNIITPHQYQSDLNGKWCFDFEEISFHTPFPVALLSLSNYQKMAKNQKSNGLDYFVRHGHFPILSFRTTFQKMAGESQKLSFSVKFITP